MSTAWAHRRFYTLKSRADKLGAVLPFTKEAFAKWLAVHKDDICPCGIKATDIDHKIPLARGGSHALTNYQMLCGPCNRKKWRWLDHEERMWPWQIPGFDRSKLRRKPRKNRVEPAVVDFVDSLKDESPITHGGVRLKPIGGGLYVYDLPDIL